MTIPIVGEETEVQREWVALLRVANVVSGRAGIVCSGELELFLVLPGIER